MLFTLSPKRVSCGQGNRKPCVPHAEREGRGRGVSLRSAGGWGGWGAKSSSRPLWSVQLGVSLVLLLFILCHVPCITLLGKSLSEDPVPTPKMLAAKGTFPSCQPPPKTDRRASEQTAVLALSAALEGGTALPLAHGCQAREVLPRGVPSAGGSGFPEPRWEAAAASTLSAAWLRTRSSRAVGRPVSGQGFPGRTGGRFPPHLQPCALNRPASLPHVVSRMGKLEHVDVHLFCLVAADFYRHQIEEELDRRAFQSVFEVVAAPGNPYHRLLACLRNVHKVTTC